MSSPSEIQELPKITITVCQSGTEVNRSVTLDVSRAIQEVFDSLFLSDAQKQQGFDQAVAELIRQLPDFAKCSATVVSIPKIEDQALSHFVMEHMPQADAEQLASEVGLKILKCVFGGWPRGNVGAWRAKIRHNVGVDYLRKLDREKTSIGTRHNNSHLVDYADPKAAREALEREAQEELDRKVSKMPPDAWKIVARLREGEEWPPIAADHRLSEEDARRMVQREWPGGSSPKPNKRLNRRSSRR